jgi:hypothetical protein
LDRIGETAATGTKHGEPSYGGATKLYCGVKSASVEKRYKLSVSRGNKNVFKTNISPTEMKVGIKTLKSLKDGRVLTEVGSTDETNLLSTNFRDKCGGALEFNVPKLRNPRMIIRNIAQHITADNLEETILTQNPDFSKKQRRSQPDLSSGLKRWH